LSDRIRRVVAEHARLATDVQTLSDDADLYSAGLTSHSSVNLMIALEDEFGVEFPDEALRKSTFQSMSAIADVLDQLGVPKLSLSPERVAVS
jgi:acyl carrier protein